VSKKKIENWGGAREGAFDDSTVARIRKMAADGKKPAEIAREVGNRYDTVTRVIKGLSYKHLPLVDAYKPAAAALTDAGTVKPGDAVTDCDPRKDRTGVILTISAQAVTVKWNTGKETAVKLSAIHRKPDSKKGYRLAPSASAVAFAAA
jgi:hypothetical protein